MLAFRYEPESVVVPCEKANRCDPLLWFVLLMSSH